MTGSASFDIATRDFEKFAANIGKMVDKELKKELKVALKAAGGRVVSEARTRYAQRSAVAAASVRAGTAVQKSGVRVVIRAGGKNAPMAQLLELGNLDHGRVIQMGSKRIKGTFRHPVFPKSEDRSKWTWTDKNSTTHPSLYPATMHQKGRVAKEIQTVIVKTWLATQPKGGS